MVMICYHGSVLIPLYVGKAEKKGVKNEISANIINIAKNKGKFARWGDACYYHIGEAVEKEVIALAYDSFPQYLLNVDGI